MGRRKNDREETNRKRRKTKVENNIHRKHLESTDIHRGISVSQV